MKNVLVALLAGIFVIAMTGCGGQAQDTPAPEEEADETTMSEPGGTPEEPPVAVETPTTPGEPATETAEAEAAEGSASLAGTKWKVKEYELDFKDAEKVLIKGGQVATLMPDGIEVPYKVEGDKLTVDVFGDKYEGTWDGEKLIVMDEEAVLQ
jgi:hypothetical protein